MLYTLSLTFELVWEDNMYILFKILLCFNQNTWLWNNLAIDLALLFVWSSALSYSSMDKIITIKIKLKKIYLEPIPNFDRIIAFVNSN
jgi:hypothetical protein